MLDLKMTQVIKRALGSRYGGLEMTPHASKVVKDALLQKALAAGKSIRQLTRFLAKLLPETLVLLKSILTAEKTPVGNAHAPIPGAYPLLAEVPSVATETTTINRTEEKSALIRPKTPVVEPVPETSKQPHSEATDHVRVKSAQVQPEISDVQPVPRSLELSDSTTVTPACLWSRVYVVSPEIYTHTSAHIHSTLWHVQLANAHT